jgi:hypothetical protein
MTHDKMIRNIMLGGQKKNRGQIVTPSVFIQ